MSQSSNGGCIKCHRFEDYTFLKPTACNVCGDMIWGFGLQCSDCIYRCHEGCKKKVVYHLSSSVEFNSEHTFSVASFGRVTHCNLCRGLVLGVINQGLKCGVCKYIVHNDCAPKVPNCCRVSAVSSVTDGKMAHHWVEGNMRPSAACEVCNKSCNALTLMNFMCAWCKKCVHTTCLESFNRECDFGIHSKSIIPPFCFINGAGASENEWVAHKLPYKPLIVFVNPKSGGQQGIKLLRKLQYLLNPGIQVYSLIPNGPTAGLAVIKTAMQNACQGQSDSNNAIDFRVLVCGGDGTAGWVLQAMAEIGLEVPVGIIPLGTGNDLARTLGWGPGYDGENLSKLLSEIEMAQIRTLDRWNITITPLKEGEVVKKIMTNYLSVGVDAKVALNFHLQREANPEQFKNRFVNKLWYTKFGAEAFFNGCEELNKSVTVEVDGKILELPKLEGVCIVNLPSYAAGTNLWGTTDIPKGLQQQAIDDCLLEVVGVEGSGHLGQIQTGLSHGIKLGQGHAIKITFHDTAFPVQVDGEPWMQTPACITITIRDQVPMLAHR